MRIGRWNALGILLLGLVLPLSAATAQDSVIYLDFDDDDDPYTIRETLPLGELVGTARFVLEVGQQPLGGVHLFASIEEGCVNDYNNDAHYGTWVDPESVVLDPTYAGNLQLSFATCTYCCPWLLEADIVADPPVVPGQRYFIGQGTWYADCDDPFNPPSSFAYTWEQGVTGSGLMTLGCPPVATEPTSWGTIRALYR